MSTLLARYTHWLHTRWPAGTVETLRRAFGRRVGVAPAAYRDRFRNTEREA